MFDKHPLVSIMIPNFNHGRYLDECIQSVLAQTYPNIEIVLLDNQSADNSLDVAVKYHAQGVRVCRNVYNCMNRSYRILSEQLTSGEFMLLLGADDAIAPSFVERAVRIMMRYPEVGYVHGERDFIREDGSLIELDPFFDCSFVAPGENVMPIYMVTTIAHPAQGIFRRSAFERIGGYEMEIDHMNADKSLWFYLSSVSDYAYIRDKMCSIRISSNTQTALTVRNFQHPVLCHLTINDFARYAMQRGFPKVLERKDEALARLGKDCLNYAGGSILQGDYDNAGAYLCYARLLDRKLSATEHWLRLYKMCEDKQSDRGYLASLNTVHENRPRNYPPPQGFVRINGATGQHYEGFSNYTGDHTYL